jgi:membrane associated rhomboid family serine protease
MWLAKTVEYFLPTNFKPFGLYPRTIEGLKGIICSPFIHEDFKHLTGNTLPFFLLSTAIFYFYRKQSHRIILYLWFLTETAVWLGARSAIHIGASGLVYAFASFLFFSGILSKERRLIAISLLVIFLYGGMIWGIFPESPFISWESHLFGTVSGFIISFYIGKLPTTEVLKDENDDDDEFTDLNSTHDKEYEVHYDYKEEND